MNILLISPLPPAIGGIATWTEKYLAHANEYGIDAKVVNIAPIGRRATNINEKKSLVEEAKRTYRIIADLRKKLKVNDPDIVHMNTSLDRFGMMRDILCARIVKRSQKKLIIHCRCNIGTQINNRLSYILFKRLMMKADQVIALNRRSRRYVKRHTDRPVTIIPNFIEDDFCASCSEADLPLAEKSGNLGANTSEKHIINDTIKRVIYTGRIVYSKGYREMVEAARQLPDIDFYLYGSIGEDILSGREYDPMVTSAESQLDTDESDNTSLEGSDIPNNLYMPGSIDHVRVKEELMKADVFLFPSYSEGFPNALLEAMACGLPVIASDVGANADMIEDKGGIIIPPKDADSIVEAIRQLDDPKSRRRMSDWNRQTVNDHYTLSSVIVQLKRLYESVAV